MVEQLAGGRDQALARRHRVELIDPKKDPHPQQTFVLYWYRVAMLLRAMMHN
jgi:hypothetical protein